MTASEPPSLRWPLVPLAGALSVAAATLLLHSFPVGYGGLYLAQIDAIIASQYAVPTSIPAYGVFRLPFASPSLLFYPLAFFKDGLGIDGLVFARVVPAVGYLLAVGVLYRLAREIVGSAYRAGVAAFIYAVTPAAIGSLLTGEGMITSFGLAIALASFLAGLRLFQTGQGRWMAVGSVAFASVLLVHPSLALWVLVSYLYFFMYYDRTATGLFNWILVGVIGTALASPWYLLVIGEYGLVPFTYAFAGGFDAVVGLRAVVNFFWVPHARLLAVYRVLALFGAIVLIGRKRYFLPGWFAVSLVSVVGEAYLFVIPAMMAAVVVDELRETSLDHAFIDQVSGDRVGSVVFTAGILAYGLFGGVLYTAQYPGVAAADGMPTYVDGEDARATAWVAANTPFESRFAVIGPESEWFPAIANRRSMTAYWGLGWGPPSYQEDVRTLYRRTRQCGSASCIDRTLNRSNVTADFVYASRDGLPGDGDVDWTAFRDSFEQSPTYSIEYETEDVLVARRGSD